MQRYWLVTRPNGPEFGGQRFETHTGAMAMAEVVAAKYPGFRVVVLEAVAVACSEPGPVVFTDPTDPDGESS